MYSHIRDHVNISLLSRNYNMYVSLQFREEQSMKLFITDF